MKQELISEYRDLLPAMPPDQWRRVRGEQEIIVRYAPDEALATLPGLLRNVDDRKRLVTLVQRLLADERVQRARPSNEQLAMIENIGQTLEVTGGAARRAPAQADAQDVAQDVAQGGGRSPTLTRWNACTPSTSGCSSSASHCRRPALP